jgi:uncharacterized damage-inducible protein DinB
MKPEAAVALRDFFATGLAEEAKTTRRVLEAVPEKGNDYRPDAKSRTGFELAWHIASSDAWFLDGILAGEFKMEGDTSGKVPPEIKTVADIVAYYDKNYIPKIERLRSLSPEALAKVVTFFGMFNFPLAVYISWLNNHQIHHRGQLCAYLRAMGGKVPNIYGGSADEPMEMGTSA